MTVMEEEFIKEVADARRGLSQFGPADVSKRTITT
jgi:hypothetical protein